MEMENIKTAIVHEWLVNYMGSEKCVESFVNIWPSSDIFSLVDFLDASDRNKILRGKHASTSFIQNLPLAKNKFRNYLSLFPMAIEQLDISNYDIVISSAHAVAKGVLTNANQMHISYCHSPMRYAWDLYFQYINESGLDKGIKGWFAKRVLHKLRMWDYATAPRVDHFIANSNHIAKRIKKVYNRNADVIYPPVDVDNFELETNKEDYFLTVSRFVPYKKIDLIVEAFSKMPDKKLVVVGSGPDTEKIKKLATPNIELVGYQSFESLKTYMQKAKAFLFAAEEDFGITIVEAQSCGTPVIAYKVGGASETVIDKKTGVLFPEQTVNSLIDGVKIFDDNENKFDSTVINEHASQFSRQNYETNIKNFVDQKWKNFKNS